MKPETRPNETRRTEARQNGGEPMNAKTSLSAHGALIALYAAAMAFAACVAAAANAVM